MSKRDYLKQRDLSASETEQVLERAEEFRLLRKLRTPHATRAGHVLGMLFEKASTRTRASFEIGCRELGGHPVVLNAGDSQIGRGEPLRDTARVLSGYCHAIMIRTFGQARAEELASYASVPVINGLTDLLHPCQLLADLQTVLMESTHRTRGASSREATSVGSVLRSHRYAWIGDGNNMANSWIESAGLLGLELSLACPEGYDPDPALIEDARKNPQAKITVVRDPREAIARSTVVSTDVFASMGQEAEAEARRKVFASYCLDEALLKVAAPEAIVLHCLPAHRGEEISESVLEGRQSRVWQQAENRLHAQKALLEFLLVSADSSGK